MLRAGTIIDVPIGDLDTLSLFNRDPRFAQLLHAYKCPVWQFGHGQRVPEHLRPKTIKYRLLVDITD